MEFNSVDAALSGLSLLRRRPAVYGWWLVFNLVYVSLILAILYFLFAGWVQQIVQLVQSHGEPTPALFLSLLPRFGLAVLVFIPLGLIYGAMQIGAATRAILAPEDSRFGYLRFGADEGRLILVNLVLFLIRFGVQIVFTVLIGIVFGAVMAANRGHAGPGGVFAVQTMQQVLQIPLYAALAFLFIKFALAFPLTLDQKRVNVFGSWTMTSGRFLPMLVTYVIAFVIWLGITIAAGLLVMMVLFGAAGAFIAGMGSTFQNNPAEAVAQLMKFLPVLIATIAALTGLFAPLAMALFYCPGARIYTAITGRTEDVF